METTLLRALENLKRTGENQGVFSWTCIWMKCSAKWMNEWMQSLNVQILNEMWNTVSSFDAHSSTQILSSQSSGEKMKESWKSWKIQFMRKGSGCSRDLRTKSLCSQSKHSIKHRLDLEDSSGWQIDPRTGNWTRSIRSDIWCILSIGRMIYHWNIFPVLWQMSHH